MLSEETEAVSVVYHYAEAVFLLEGSDLVELSKSSRHSIYAFSYEEYSASVGISLGAGPGENLLAILNVVVAIFLLAAEMETDTVKQTGVALGIIYNDIVT